MWTRAWVAAATLMCLSMTLPAHAGAGVSHYIDNADVLFSTNPQPADQAGFSVAISETHAVVGAYYAAGFESFTGNAFVYEYTPDEDDYTPDWTYVVDLAGLPGMGVLTATDGFGYDVDINGDRIVVSAPGYGDGSVFVFREIADDWTLEETIDNPLFQAAWSFGLSVSIENDLVVIGDPYYDNGSSTGLVWPFSVGGGMRNALPLPPSDGRSGRGFILHYIGWSVDLDEDLLVVGAPGTNVDGVANVGMAYAYRILEDGTYYFEGFLDTPDDWVGVPTQFGFSISADGFEDVVAVGGPNGELGSGIVGVFRKNERTWEEDAVLQDRPVVDLTEFGRSVSVDGNLIVVGVPKASDNGSGSGHSSVFRYSPSGATWSYEDTIVPYGTDTNAWFGTSVDVIGNRFIGGAPLLRLGGITVAQVGAAYVYTQQDNGDWQSDTRPALPVKIAEQSIESPLAEAAPDDLSSFGYDVAISGNVALVGDPTGYYSKLGGGAGLVHVYTRSSIESPWIYDAKNLIPVPDDIAIDDGFGFSVAMEGDLAVVGAPGWQISSSPGSAWLFERNPSTGAWGTGIEIRTGSASEHVGWSVAISEDPDGDHVIVVGAPGVNGDVDGGRAYIHMYSDGDGVWDEGYVSPSLSGFYSMFGWCVDAGVSYVDNEIRIAVGDPEFPGQVGTQEDSKYGAVEIFMRSVTGGWYRTTTIDPTADLVSSTNDFGRSLDLNGSLLAVGDPLADLTFEEAGNSKVDSGLAAIYELNAGIWEFRSVFYSPFYQPGDMFGYDVQIHNGGKGEFSRLVATAKGSNYSVSDGGAAVSYIRSDYGPATEWDMERVLLPLNASQDESVGWSVAMDGTSVLVGHGTDTTNDDARVLGFEMNDAISFIATWFSELGSAEAWNTPPDWGQQITAVFSLWLAEPHVVDFFTPLGYLWNGSLLVELDDVTLQIRPEGALVSGSVSVAGEATLRSAVLQVEGESFLEILGDLVVGPENYAGQLVLDQESIVVRGNLELGPDSACKTVLFDLINSDDPMLIADDVDIKGSLAVELGEIDPATLSEGDQWTIISSDTIPPSGSDRFSVVILPAISESLAFQLSYGAPAARDDESTRGSWTVVIDVVTLPTSLISVNRTQLPLMEPQSPWKSLISMVIPPMRSV